MILRYSYFFALNKDLSNVVYMIELEKSYIQINEDKLMKKIIFLDVDGTLVNDNGIVPESAEIAVKKAMSNGHYVFLCTGRSKAELFDHIMQLGFDGIIAAAGGYIEFENKVVMHKKVKNEDVNHLVTYFNENNIDFYLESNGGLFASKNCKDHLRKIIFGNINSDPKIRAEL